MSDLPISSPVEQASSAINGNSSRELTAGKKVGIAVLVVGVALGVIWLRAGLHQAAQHNRDETLEAAAYGTGDTLRPPPTGTAPAPAAPMPPQQATIMNTVGGQDDPAAKALASGIMAFSSNAAPLPAPAAGGPIEAARAVAEAGAGGGGELATRLKPTVMQGAKATLLPHPDYLITEGTIIPCTLQTAIDSTLVGFVKCVLPQAVRSTTGDVVLLDRGTTIVGQVQSGLMQGQNRLFILWTRAETPDHVIIALDSPAADSLGRAGVDGEVNNHFWQRFGGAIMLSFIDTGLQAGGAVAGSALSSNGGVSFNSFQSNGQNAAATALQNTINIPPTLTKNQGENVSVFVARDLDFSDVYHLQVTR